MAEAARFAPRRAWGLLPALRGDSEAYRRNEGLQLSTLIFHVDEVLSGISSFVHFRVFDLKAEATHIKASADVALLFVRLCGAACLHAPMHAPTYLHTSRLATPSTDRCTHEFLLLLAYNANHCLVRFFPTNSSGGYVARGGAFQRGGPAAVRATAGS